MVRRLHLILMLVALLVLSGCYTPSFTHEEKLIYYANKFLLEQEGKRLSDYGRYYFHFFPNYPGYCEVHFAFPGRPPNVPPYNDINLALLISNGRVSPFKSPRPPCRRLEIDPTGKCTMLPPITEPYERAKALKIGDAYKDVVAALGEIPIFRYVEDPKTGDWWTEIAFAESHETFRWVYFDGKGRIVSFTDPTSQDDTLPAEDGIKIEPTWASTPRPPITEAYKKRLKALKIGDAYKDVKATLGEGRAFRFIEDPKTGDWWTEMLLGDGNGDETSRWVYFDGKGRLVSFRYPSLLDDTLPPEVEIVLPEGF